MIVDSKPKRAAGFIRTNSFKRLSIPHQRQPSDDDFSSFEDHPSPKHKNIQRQFSPYRHQQRRQLLQSRPPIPHKLIRERPSPNIFSNEKLRRNYQENNFIASPPKGRTITAGRLYTKSNEKRKSVQQELAQVSRICQSIEQSLPTPSQYSSRSRQSQNKQSRRKGTQNMEQQDEPLVQNWNTMNLNSPTFNHRAAPIRVAQKYEFQESSVSEEEQEESSSGFFNTFKKTNNSPPLQVQHRLTNYGSSRHQQFQKSQTELARARQRFINDQSHSLEEEHPEDAQEDSAESEEDPSHQGLIAEYPVDQFKRHTIKECVITMNQQPSNQNTGVFKAKGGVCFDLDVNQFTQPDVREKTKPQPAPPKKAKKANTKQEILKRRQMAKNYDKVARMKVFGGF